MWGCWANVSARSRALSHSQLPQPGETKATMIKIPVFVERLRITYLYRRFLLLSNTSRSTEAAFRLLLSLVPRETITSYSPTCLYIRLKISSEVILVVFYPSNYAALASTTLILPHQPRLIRDWRHRALLRSMIIYQIFHTKPVETLMGNYLTCLI